jgi:hypothetical protein
MKGNAMTDMLQEFCDSRGASMRVDAQAGVIRGVKLLGLESRNGRTYLPDTLAQAARLYEDGSGLQAALETFMRLAKEGQRILDAYWEIGFCGPYSWNLPSRYPPCYVGDHYDWLTLVCQQSPENYFFPGTLSVTAKLPMWQFEFSLLQQQNVFAAAAEALDAWLPSYWDHRIEPSNADSSRPRWDADSRTLWFGNTLVKDFSKNAGNQFILLEAFEAAQWCRTITAPKCFLTNLRTRRGIRETVDGLNRRHAANAIRFHKLGVEVSWEPVS